MSEKRLKRQHLKRRLLNKNRIVLFNENTFEEIFSIKVNLLNVIGGTVTLFLFLIVSTLLLIVFTPLKEYIPGYSSAELKRSAMAAALKMDSLEQQSIRNEAYISAVQKVLTGELPSKQVDMDSLVKTEMVALEGKDFEPSEKDLQLREYVRLEDKYNVFQESKPKVNTLLFTPVKGAVMQSFNLKEQHFGVDVALAQNTPIKTVASGTVVFAEWTPKDGNIIIIRHAEGMLSVYKHVASLSKGQGDVVKSGEVIALATASNQNPNKHSNHLHFELWKDSYPIDPVMYIDFD